MDFCPKCGRQRSGSDRFCAGCGTEYPERASDVTRVDVPAEVTRLDTPAAAKPPAGKPADDPFASWFAPDSHGQWQPTETLHAAPTGQGASPPAASQPGPAYPTGPAYPPGPGYPQAPRQGPSGGRRAAVFLAGLLVVLAAGGGAYALVSLAGKHNSSRPPAASTGPASASGGSTTSAPPAASGAATGSSTATATSSPGGVALAPGVAANPAVTQAQAVLGHYFHGINAHDYAEYASVLDAGTRASQPESAFKSGYGSTQDSGMTLTSLSSTGSGTLAATVTFTSHQDPAQSVDHSSCNNWTLTLYLVRQGSGYLITHAPAGYHPAYTDC